MARILGIGGVFFKARDPKSLAAWYRDHLGLPIEDWGGASLSNDDGGGRQNMAVWSPFSADTSYFAPSQAAFMINFRVDDLDGILARLAGAGITAEGRSDDDPNGRFAWVMDPEGNKIELWEPPAQ